MNDSIFYAIGKTRRGPVSIDDLRILVAKGEFRRTDLVWREGMPKWQPAVAIPEIFEGMPPDLDFVPSSASDFLPGIDSGQQGTGSTAPASEKPVHSEPTPPSPQSNPQPPPNQSSQNSNAPPQGDSFTEKEALGCLGVLLVIVLIWYGAPRGIIIALLRMFAHHW
jgi:hypothetical protein